MKACGDDYGFYEGFVAAGHGHQPGAPEVVSHPQLLTISPSQETFHLVQPPLEDDKSINPLQQHIGIVTS